MSVGGRHINNLRFADDIDLLAESMKELDELTKRLDETATAFGMEIRSEKSNILTTSGTFSNNTNPPITVRRKQLKRVNEFKYLESFTENAIYKNAKEDLEEPCH